MQPYSLLFNPILKEKVWGGHALTRLGKSIAPGLKVGESWELADLPAQVEGGRSVIANGPLEGRTLREAIAEHRDLILGAAKLTPEGGFPLLVKYLDACENLSVQVHPDEHYVHEHPGTDLKSEAWYVIEAKPDAVIYKGVDPAVTAEQFAEHLRADNIVDDLISIPVKADDCHYLPSGTCHALGGGIVVAEIQTPSDTTFRVHDWGRTGRALHIDEALQCIQFGPGPHNRPIDPNIAENQPRNEPIEVKDVCTQPLVNTEFFAMERVTMTTPGRLEIVTNGMPLIWMILQGSGRVDASSGLSTPLRTGDTVLHPAALLEANALFDDPVSLLQITLPSPLKGMLA